MEISDIGKFHRISKQLSCNRCTFDLFAGGDPITAGTRYVIAAFLFLQEDANETASVAAKRNLIEDSVDSSVFKQARVNKEDSQSSFAFNFDE